MQLNDHQHAIAIQPGKTFLEGAAGTGKTTTALARLRYFLERDISPSSIMVIVPQRTLALPYYNLLNNPGLTAGTEVNIMTLGGLARQGADLFFPVVAQAHGFVYPERRPTFLSLETAQYFMARVVGPVIDQRLLFDTVTIDRNRLYSQLIDNLNKAAVVGFPYTELGERLKASTSDPVQQKVYEDVQTCADLFRAYCLEHNLLDFSLQVEIYMQRIWDLPEYQAFIRGTFNHLIIDNVEEDTPAAHTVYRGLIEQAESALVIYDSDAGYRRFLGADPIHAYALKSACDQHMTFRDSFVVSPELDTFGTELARSLYRDTAPNPNDSAASLLRAGIRYDSYKYHPEMIDGVAEHIAVLVHGEGVDPNEIVVLAPYLSDALRFSLMNRLQAADVPVRSHRPSRSLREEPAALCLLTLAQLAHPGWNIIPTPFDVVYALMESIGELDLVRAQLLARYVYQVQNRKPRLEPFQNIKPEFQERITFVLGERYDHLRMWINDYITFANTDGSEPLALDHFFSRLFGEVLSQPGFGFHDDFDAAKVAANLIDSAQKFRWIITESGAPLEDKTLAQEYVEMVGQGVIADQYLRGWDVEAEDAVLLAPAYTFLMTNRPVDYQFWLNVGGRGWSERLYQPLTNPYVLSVQWQPGRKWTDNDEVIVAQDGLHALTVGLVRRCRKQIYLGFSELGEQGYEQRGELLSAIQRMLKRTAEASQL